LRHHVCQGGSGAATHVMVGVPSPRDEPRDSSAHCLLKETAP
jgi:hypothetical protein